MYARTRKKILLFIYEDASGFYKIEDQQNTGSTVSFAVKSQQHLVVKYQKQNSRLITHCLVL